MVNNIFLTNLIVVSNPADKKHVGFFLLIFKNKFSAFKNSERLSLKASNKFNFCSENLRIYATTSY